MALHPTPTPGSGKPASRLPSPNLEKQQDEEGRVSDPPRGNYQLAHPKDEWQLTEDGELVPVIVPLSKSPGVQGVDRRGNFSHAKAYYLERGFTLIPHDVLPSDYVALYLNKRGQKVHRSVFQTPLDGPNGTLWVFDGDAWTKFIRLLRARGYVTAPRPHIIRGMLHSKQQEYDHLRPPAIEDASRRDSYDRKVKMLQRQLASLEEELAKSIEAHGDDRSLAHDEIGGLLDEALAEAEGDAEALAAARASKPTSGKRKGRKPTHEPSDDAEVEA